MGGERREERVEDLFQRTLASMNAGRYKPIPESEHAFIRQCCEEQVIAINQDTREPDHD